MLLMLNRIVARVYDELAPLMILDPLLLAAFVYICPRAELCSLFMKIPSFVATAWLLKLIKDSRSFGREKVSIT